MYMHNVYAYVYEPQGFNIAFTNLSVYANGKQLLGEVNGTIPGGKVTAIMG